MPPINTDVPPRIVGTGIVELITFWLDRYWPESWISVPGASGAPPIGLKKFAVELCSNTGALFGVTAPAIWMDDAASPAAVARAVIVVCAALCRGVHVPSYSPLFGSALLRSSGGSPFENVTTTWPFPTGPPQSSTTVIAISTGHAAGAAKLLTSAVDVGTTLVAVQPGMAGGTAREERASLPDVPEAAASTTIVTFTERTAAPAYE